jgi:putative ABC transport system substrate-binding protein
MRRREFLTFIGATFAAYPLAVDAQQNERARRIAVLIGVVDDAEGQPRFAAFRKGMHDLGWSEGRDTEIDVRFAAGDADRARAYWAELIRSAPDVILANSAIVVAALKQQTTTILLHCTCLLFRAKAASCWLLA